MAKVSMGKSPFGMAFDQGYACAVANIIRTHGDEQVARDVLAANKPDPQYIDRSDLKVLQKAGLMPGARMGE